MIILNTGFRQSGGEDGGKGMLTGVIGEMLQLMDDFAEVAEGIAAPDGWTLSGFAVGI